MGMQYQKSLFTHTIHKLQAEMAQLQHQCNNDEQQITKIDRPHFLKRLFGAVVGNRQRRQRQKQQPQTQKSSSSSSLLVFPKASTRPPVLSDQDIHTLKQFSQQTLQGIPNFVVRASRVSLAQTQPWWLNDTDIPGLGLLYSYYRIMVNNGLNHEQLTSRFPFSKCRKQPQPCPLHYALEHTLTWRERYQPWRIAPSVLQENKVGWVYTRGFARPSNDHHENDSYGGQHALIWVRPGQVSNVISGDAYFRAILHTVERAIAAALQLNNNNNNNGVGKFNVIVDAQDYHYRKMPNLGTIKRHLVLLQDHYPDRLGMMFLCRMSRPAEFFVSLIKPLLTAEVREKIVLVPQARQDEYFQALTTPEYIPTWLGGTDDYQFDANEYYAINNNDKEQGQMIMSDEESVAWQTNEL